jgi:hypothetical protein
MFASVGNQAYRLWKLDDSNELLYFDMELPENDLNLTAVALTSVLGEPYNASIVLIGTIEGDIILSDPENGGYLAKINSVMQGAITLIECREKAIILVDDAASIVRHQIIEGAPLFTEPGIILNLDGPITAISFDEELNEGQIGTCNNTLSYVDWNK